MTKTLIDIPDELLAEAMELMGARTKAEAVRRALGESVQRRNTPAMRRARELDVAYTDHQVEVAGELSQGRADDLVESIRADRDRGRV